MKYNLKLQTKLILVLVLFVFIFIAVGLFTFLRFRTIYARFETFSNEKNKLERIVEESLILFGQSTDNLNSVLFEDSVLEEIALSEDAYNENSLKLKVLLEALINGSTTDNFKKLSEGTIYAEWSENGYDQKFGAIPKLNIRNQTVSEINILLGDYSKNAQEIFDFKRQVVRLKTEGKDASLQEIEVGNLNIETRELRTEINTNLIKLVDQGAVVFDEQASAIKKELQEAFILALVLLVISATLIISISVWFVKIKLVSPVVSMAKISELVASGRYDIRSFFTSDDELGVLSGNFNKMIDSVVGSQDLLQQRITERTREIQEKSDRAEVISKLMIGRELKMIELKKQNEELRKKII